MWHKKAVSIVSIIINCPFSEVPQLAQWKSEVAELQNPSDVTLKWPESWDGWYKLIWWGQWMYSKNLVRLLNPLLPKSFGVSHEYQNCYSSDTRILNSI